MTRTENATTPHIDEALEQLSRLTLREASLSGLLQRAVLVVGSVMPPGSETSLALRSAAGSTWAATDDRAGRLDAAQFADGRGPAAHAWRTGTETEVIDARADVRWPGHTARATGAGLLSSLSIPLLVDLREGGALTVWTAPAGGIDPVARRAAHRLAPHVRAAVTGMQDRSRARAMADDLDVEFETRAMIGRAQGILVERLRVTPERAAELMAQRSVRDRVGLREVAARLIRRERGLGRQPVPPAR